MKEIKIWTDGGALNNPGKAAIAFIIQINNQIKEYPHLLKGEHTNNEAEYYAVIYAFKKVKQLIGKKNLKEYKIKLFLDSELVGNQILGRYKIKDKKLAILFVMFWNIKLDFGDIEVNIIPREENSKADKLVKNILFQKNLFS
jgi:ribonuclease HI